MGLWRVEKKDGEKKTHKKKPYNEHFACLVQYVGCILDEVSTCF